ncbi:unknown [Segatella copri CAG:164]|nr:unknown [Segatella copri CAG:164]
MVIRLNHGTTCVTILLLHLVEFVLHYLLAELRIVQNLVQVVDGLHQLVEFIVQLLQTQACQLAEAHIHDCLTLKFIEFEALLQVALGIRWSLAGSDNMYHLIDVVAGNDQALENMSTLLSLLQFELGAADCNIMTMFYEILHTLLQAQKTWAAINKSDAIH